MEFVAVGLLQVTEQHVCTCCSTVHCCLQSDQLCPLQAVELIELAAGWATQLAGKAPAHVQEDAGPILQLLVPLCLQHGFTMNRSSMNKGEQTPRHLLLQHKQPAEVCAGQASLTQQRPACRPRFSRRQAQAVCQQCEPWWSRCAAGSDALRCCRARVNSLMFAGQRGCCRPARQTGTCCALALSGARKRQSNCACSSDQG